MIAAIKTKFHGYKNLLINNNPVHRVKKKIEETFKSAFDALARANRPIPAQALNSKKVTKEGTQDGEACLACCQACCEACSKVDCLQIYIAHKVSKL